MKKIKRLHGKMNMVDQLLHKDKSVKSSNPCKSVIQTIYDIVKAHNGMLKLETKADVADPSISGEGNPDNFGKREGSTFSIQLPVV